MPGTPAEQLLARLRELRAQIDSVGVFAASAGADEVSKDLARMAFVIGDHVAERQGEAEEARAAQ